MPKKKKTVVSFLLDETGSMSSIKDDTIGGFNEFVNTLKGEDVEFSLVKFDSNRVDKVYSGVPIKDVEPLTNETYRPGAATPLIDASVQIIRATEDAVGKRKAKVVVVIQTDGLENASTEFSLTDLQGLIKEKTEEGWEFVFIGAGIDAFSVGASFGIAAGQTLSYDRGATKDAFTHTASNVAAYAATGHATLLSYTPEQRSASGDKFHTKKKKAKT